MSIFTTFDVVNEINAAESNVGIPEQSFNVGDL
jgi:hypothetical protein